MFWTLIYIYIREKNFMHKPFSFVCYVFLLFLIINVFFLFSFALFYEFDRFFKVQKGWRVQPSPLPPITQCMRESRHEQNNQPTIYIVYVNNKDCSERWSTYRILIESGWYGKVLKMKQQLTFSTGQSHIDQSQIWAKWWCR